MKVLLTHGFFLEDDPIEKAVMRPYAPLGLLYISAYLDQNTKEHEVFDSTFQSFQELKNKLQNFIPDILGIYANFLTRKNIIQIVNYIRGTEKLKHMVIALGGPDVRFHTEDYLHKGIDFIIVGEGEETFLELVKAIEMQQEVSGIKGLIYKNDEGELIQNPERTHIRELDGLPFPNRHKINIQKYLEVWKNHHGYSSVTVNTQRGCPFTCNWCSHAVFGDTYRRRSPESVVNELELIKRDYNPDSIWFVDDVFTMSERWIDHFSEELQKRNLKISYECISRADKLNEEIIIKLRDTGCKTLWIGAESGSQKVIDLMDRRVDVLRVRAMIRLAKKHGIEAGTFIMLGYPGETIRDIRETITHLKESLPDTFTINLAYPIKGTRLYDEVANQITTHVNWSETPDRDIDFKRTYKRAFYDFAIRKVYNEVYAHRSLKQKQYASFFIHKIKGLLAGTLMFLSR
ncbi:MAG TPA: radical SAM protein [Bacteroidales bacterium]|nr:radical SAM protein [Bacteroidales bacterium]